MSPEKLGELLVKNRKPLKSLASGTDVLFLQLRFDGEQELCQGTLIDCDECGAMSTMNTHGFSAISERFINSMPFVYSSKLLESDSIGCYDDDGSGDVLCPECSNKRGK